MVHIPKFVKEKIEKIKICKINRFNYYWMEQMFSGKNSYSIDWS